MKEFIDMPLSVIFDVESLMQPNMVGMRLSGPYFDNIDDTYVEGSAGECLNISQIDEFGERHTVVLARNTIMELLGIMNVWMSETNDMEQR